MTNRRTQLEKRPAPRPGVSLMELVVTLAVAALLVSGLARAVRLASMSMNNTTVTASLATSEALDQLNADLRMAKSFTERTSTAVTFTVPDRTGDGAPETVRYAWAGAGSPLTRSQNGLPSPAATLVGNVQSLNLTYMTRTVQPLIQESAEQLLSSHTTAYSTQLGIRRRDWYSQAFKPSLPSNAIFWKINYVQLMLSRSATSGTLNVALYATNVLNAPTGPALSSATINVASLTTSPAWVTIPLPPLANIDPAAGMAIVVSSTNNSVQASVAAKTLILLPPAGQAYSNSTNQGSSWPLPLGTTALDFRVYGTITTMGP